MKKEAIKYLTFGFLCIVLNCIAANAQTFINGGLEGPQAYFGLPPGWSRVLSTYANSTADPGGDTIPHTVGTTGPFVSIGVVGNPHSGLTYVEMDVKDFFGTMHHTGIMQSVAGFTVGDTYEISFCQAVDKSFWERDTSGSFSVYFDNTLIATTAPTVSQDTMGSTNFLWEQRVVTFTATNTTHNIVFLPTDDDANNTGSTTDVNGGLAMGLDSLFITNISTPQPPTISLTLSNDTICEGNCSSLAATITGGTAPFTVTWDNGVPNGIGSHNVCPLITTTYTAIVTDSVGLSDTASILLTVNPQDTSAFSYSSGSYCLTNPNPTPSITGTLGGNFTINNSGTINSNTGQIDIAASGVGNYIVTYITNGVCPDTATINIIINNCVLPPPIANFSASQTNICSGDCINFTDLSTSSATGGISNWTWSFVGADSLSSSVQNPINICYQTPGTYSVMLTVTDSNGIDDTTIVNYITVTSCIAPTGGYTVSDSILCEGECIDFTDVSSGATSWQWTFNGAIPSTSTSQNPINICFNTAGAYTIEQIVSNASGADTLTSTIVVNANPVVNAGLDVTVDLGISTTLTATGTNGTYTWSPPDWLSCITCPTTISTPDQITTYTVTVVDSNGCTATDDVTVIVDFDNVVFVPNIFSPNGDGNNDILFVRGKGIESFQFMVYDRWGEKVFESTDLSTGWDGNFRGKEMNKTVFVYYLKGSFKDGSKFNQKGDITLIR